MIRLGAQIFGFLTLSLGLHLGAATWIGAGAPQNMVGDEAAGDHGHAQLSLSAAPQDLAALVDQWSRPPELSQVIPDVPPMAAPLAPMRPEIAPLAPPNLTESRPELAPQLQEAAPALEPEVPNAPMPTAPAPRPATRASGGAEAAPTTTTAAISSEDQDVIMRLMSHWGSGILRQLERSPSRPRGRGAATLRLVIDADGRLHDVRILAGTGQADLDTALLAFVAEASPYPPAPDGISAARYNFDLPLRLR